MILGVLYHKRVMQLQRQQVPKIPKIKLKMLLEFFYVNNGIKILNHCKNPTNFQKNTTTQSP